MEIVLNSSKAYTTKRNRELKQLKGHQHFFLNERSPPGRENLSPLIFSVYLNDLHHYLSANGVPGVECGTDPDYSIMTFIKKYS